MDAKLYITEIINELTFVKDSIREDDCTKLIDAIQQSQRVFCYGSGRAGFFHESLHHAPDAYGQRGLLPDGNHYAELWAAICLSFLPLPVRQHNWWHWRKSTSVWRRCGGVNHESTRHYHRVCRRHRANQCPSKIKRFCFPLGTADGVVV